MLRDSGRTDLVGSHEGALVTSEGSRVGKRSSSTKKPKTSFRKKPGR